MYIEPVSYTHLVSRIHSTDTDHYIAISKIKILGGWWHRTQITLSTESQTFNVNLLLGEWYDITITQDDLVIIKENEMTSKCRSFILLTFWLITIKPFPYLEQKL